MEPWMQKHTLADWRDDNFRKSGTLGVGDMFCWKNTAFLGATCNLGCKKIKRESMLHKHQSPSISLKSKRDKVRHVSPYNVVSSISRQQSEKHFVGTL